MIRKPFACAEPEEVGVHSEDVLRYLDALESSGTEMHGLMLMRRGKLFAQGWWQPYAPGLRHGLQSHTKTYAATAVGIACREGILSLDEPVIRIFPDLAPQDPGEYLRLLTVRDVLCMGCGMDTMPAPTKDWIRDFLHTPVLHKPGSVFMYNSFGSTLLGAMVRQRSGQGLHEYLKPRLFDKLGIDSGNLRWVRLPDGMEVGGGGLFATTEDNLRLMKLYMDGGVWEGEEILTPEYVRLATSSQNDSASEAAVNPPATDNFLGYGFQIWMCKPKGAYRADGAMGQFTIVLPEQDMLIAITETACGAVQAQKTLDLTWDFAARVRDSAPLPPSPAAGVLARRLRHLAIEAPVCRPYSPVAAQVSSVRYRVTQGSFGPFSGNFMSGEPADPIREFSLRFEADGILWAFSTASGRQESVRLSLSGTRLTNLIGDEDSPTRLWLCSAYWEREDTLCLCCRFAESCVEDRYSLTFAADGVTILADNNSAFRAPGGQRVDAVRIG